MQDEKSFMGKERVRDLNSVKIEGEGGMKTRRLTSSNVIDVKCCKQLSLTLTLPSHSHIVAEDSCVRSRTAVSVRASRM